jgi:hypothetical protein
MTEHAKGARLRRMSGVTPSIGLVAAGHGMPSPAWIRTPLGRRFERMCQPADHLLECVLSRRTDGHRFEGAVILKQSPDGTLGVALDRHGIELVSLPESNNAGVLSDRRRAGHCLTQLA